MALGLFRRAEALERERMMKIIATMSTTPNMDPITAPAIEPGLVELVEVSAVAVIIVGLLGEGAGEVVDGDRLTVLR